jgi:hypothetical protein
VVDNPFKVGKTQWAKWRDAARMEFNKAMRHGFGFSGAFTAAEEVNGYCIEHNIRFGPITKAPEKAPEPEADSSGDEAEVPATEPVAAKPEKPVARKHTTKRASKKG